MLRRAGNRHAAQRLVPEPIPTFRHRHVAIAVVVDQALREPMSRLGTQVERPIDLFLEWNKLGTAGKAIGGQKHRAGGIENPILKRLG